MFWVALYVYFLNLVLLCDNGRLFWDSGRYHWNPNEIPQISIKSTIFQYFAFGFFSSAWDPPCHCSPPRHIFFSIPLGKNIFIVSKYSGVHAGCLLTCSAPSGSPHPLESLPLFIWQKKGFNMAEGDSFNPRLLPPSGLPIRGIAVKKPPLHVVQNWDKLGGVS